jgi:hypothetical protein
MRATMEEKAPRKEIVEKLLILLDAAAREQKQLAVLWRLDRWIEDQIASLNLRTRVSIIVQKRGQPFGKKPLVLPIGSLRRKR